MNAHSPDDHHHKRKPLRRKSRKVYKTIQGSEGQDLLQPSPRSRQQTTRSSGSDCELSAAGISDGDEDSGSNAPVAMGIGRSTHRDHLHGPRRTVDFEINHLQASSTLSSSIVGIDEPDSPAVNSLRSLSFRVPTRSNSQGLQRVSTALANTVSLFRPKPAVSFADVLPHKASKKAEALRRSSAHSKSLAYRDINRRRPASEVGEDVYETLETPATITLRKASNVYTASPSMTSMSASLARECEYTRPSGAPSSELLAFYSSPALEKQPTLTSLPSPEGNEAPRSLRKQSTITFDMSSPSFRRGSKSVTQFSDISNARRCSMPVEAALTFADVHVAPGSFATEPKSREQPLIPIEVGRRISTVLFRSHNSIHEVIWREDETTSGSSLTGSSGASQHAGHSLRSASSPESEGNPAQKLAVEPKGKKALITAVPKSTSVFTKMPENLFRWTWGASSPHAIESNNSTHAQVAEVTAPAADTKGDPMSRILVNSTSDPDSTRLQQSSDQQGSRFQKPSLSKLPSVQSFPPLRSRSSTAEWRKTPLVDLNDPLAGRINQYVPQESGKSALVGVGAGRSMLGGEERKSSQLHSTTGGRRGISVLHARARLGSFGSIGSGIGTHSRTRILSRRKF